jgi:hypothetical protein
LLFSVVKNARRDIVSAAKLGRVEDLGVPVAVATLDLGLAAPPEAK